MMRLGSDAVGLGPDAVTQDLERLVGRFIRHFTAFPDPVAQIQPRQAQFAALLQLPQNAVAAQTAGRHTVEEGIDRRKSIIQDRSEEHTSELQSLMRISYAVFYLKKKTNTIESNQPSQSQ